MLILQQRVGGFLLGEEDGGAHDVAVAVNVSPATFLLHLCIRVVVVLAESHLVFVHRLYGPAAQVVHKTPEAVARVRHRHAPRVEVASHSPLCTGLFGLFGAHEYVVHHQHSAAVDAAPAVVLLHRGIALGVTTLVRVGGLINGLVFPAAVVVHEAPAAVGGVACRVYPFAGLGHLLPLASGILCHLLGGEHVAAHYVAVDVYAPPAAIELYGSPAACVSFEVPRALVLWHDAPRAVVVLVAEGLCGALEDRLLGLQSHCGEQCRSNYGEEFSHIGCCFIVLRLFIHRSVLSNLSAGGVPRCTSSCGLLWRSGPAAAGRGLAAPPRGWRCRQRS